MIVTKDFVFIHQPKTGGTFVKETFDEISRKETSALPLGPLRRKGLLPPHYSYTEPGEYHSTCRGIPWSERDKPILSIIRKPFDFYVSIYYFGWWASHPEDSFTDFGRVREAFPRFPDLTFDDFLILSNRFFYDFEMMGVSPNQDTLGYYSTQFVRFFFKDPEAAYAKIDDDYIAHQGWKKDMFDVDFMRTHSLNVDFHRYLSRLGYPRFYIDPVLSKHRIVPAEQLKQRPSRDFMGYYTRNTYDLVLRKERLLFSIIDDLLTA
jgi:hypothetical protein